MLSALLRHDRTLVLAGLVAVIVLSWVWLLTGAGLKMDEMDMGGGRIMLMAPRWTVQYAAMIFLMWVHHDGGDDAAKRRARHSVDDRANEATGRAPRQARERRVRVWVCRGLGRVQPHRHWTSWGLDRAGLLSENMASGRVVLAAFLLFAAGVYQLTPWKQACLRHCRSPLEFLTRYWRQGPLGPMRAGAWHGAFCLGCCWMLMGLLFVGGLMNLLWIAGLALLVLIEKLFPFGPRLAQLIGVALIGWGALVLGH